jgi:hypothetical protein
MQKKKIIHTVEEVRLDPFNTTYVFEPRESYTKYELKDGKSVSVEVTGAELVERIAADKQSSEEAAKFTVSNSKLIEGVVCIGYHPAKASGHGKQGRHHIWLTPEDQEKTQRGRIWEDVVFDQLTRRAFHVEGKSCSCHDNDRGTIGCFCDALGWPLTVSQYKKFLKDTIVNLTVFAKSLKTARIVDGYVTGMFEIVDNQGGSIWDDSDYELYKTRVEAAKELARVHEDVVMRIVKAKDAVATYDTLKAA